MSKTCKRPGATQVKRASDVLPSVKELAEIYLADDTLTVESLADRYGISYNAIRPSLNQGLALFGTSATEVRDGRRQRNKERRPRTSAELPRCTHCEILLLLDGEDEEGKEENGLCEFCQPGVIDVLAFMAQMAYEGL